MTRWGRWSALLWLACACGGPAGDPNVHWLRYATPYSPSHPFSRADKAWIEHVEHASQGRLRIDAFWSGSLLSADQSLVELRHGVADAGAIQPIYARGGAHAVRTQAGFYSGASSFEQQVRVYRCLERHYPVLRDELAGLRVLAVQGGNLPGVVTRTKLVNDVGDLQGLRLRAPSELMEVLRALGADPVNMPMGDVYASLAKGVIDGVISPPDALRSLHLAEVGRYYAELAIPRGAYPSRAIRTAVFERLPASLQALLQASGEVWEAALSREIGRALDGGRKYATEHGMQFTRLSEDDQRAFDAAYNAAARAQARALSQRGIEGDGMFRDAQQWIARLRVSHEGALPGLHALCPSG